MQYIVPKFLCLDKKQSFQAQVCLCINTLPTQAVNLESGMAFCLVVLPSAYVIFLTVINPIVPTVISLALNTVSAMKLRERIRKNAPRQAAAIKTHETITTDGKSSISEVSLLISSLILFDLFPDKFMQFY